VAAGAGSDGGVSGPVTLAAKSRANVDIIGSTFTAHWKLGPVIMSQDSRVSTSCGEAGDGGRADMFDVVGVSQGARSCRRWSRSWVPHWSQAGS
jgi:hypothetical protein